MALVALATSVHAQAPPPGAPALDAAAPLQCWWRSDAGAIRLGEVVHVTLTCAVLERPELRAVPDESRLTVAAIQMAPFEIVGGEHPPDVRSADRRFFAYRYALRIIDADVIGRDVRTPPLSIPYRVESRVGAGATLAGRDLVHLMPQLVFRVVSQVPQDATDIRDAGDADLGRIDALRFRASSFRIAAVVLGALAVLGGLSALAPLVRRAGAGRTERAGTVSEAAVLNAAAARLDALLAAHPLGELAPEALAEAHRLVRIVAGIAGGTGLRQSRFAAGAEPPEGRLVVRGGWRRTRVAVSSSATAATLDRRLDTLPATAPARRRARLEQLRDGLAALTRLQYGSSDAGAAAVDVSDVLRMARDAARELARERRWRLDAWWPRSTATAAVQER